MTSSEPAGRHGQTQPPLHHYHTDTQCVGRPPMLPPSQHAQRTSTSSTHVCGAEQPPAHYLQWENGAALRRENAAPFGGKTGPPFGGKTGPPSGGKTGPPSGGKTGLPSGGRPPLFFGPVVLHLLRRTRFHRNKRQAHQVHPVPHDVVRHTSAAQVYAMHLPRWVCWL